MVIKREILDSKMERKDMATKNRRVYEELRAGIEGQGGWMRFERSGHQWGAWRVGLGAKTATFPSNGRGFPELDALYVPKPGTVAPSHHSEYTMTLVTGAIDKLVTMLE